ncbi:diacylglycerol/lipid kinase family protein [Oerskovia enterophila]|uniref:Diacylglycerol kinase n=1 Tax=Oerskovia enterophila TaxID=43678 RepID=A0ABX2Y206_9CELL|nr:diacylglycerol kinase family protein [Oerskovia enterophila]OCI30338.1 diacylglycerol kinase [Oerskovia enterophila]
MPEAPPRPARLGVVVNPTADRGRGRGDGARTIELLRQAGHDVLDLSAPNAPLALGNARDAVAGRGTGGPLDALVVVGGDGMVHLGVNAVAGTGVPLGIVAAGTGNDFASALGLPVHAVDAAVTLLLDALGARAAGTGGTRRVDAARAEPLDAHLDPRPGRERWFCGVLSAGLDAAVNARANALTWPRGSAKYVRAVASELARFRPYGYRITAQLVGAPGASDTAGAGDPAGSTAASTAHPSPSGPATPGERAPRTPDDATHPFVWESPGTVVAVANGPRFGGGVRVAPDASIDDGLLDLVTAGPLTRLGVARVFPGMYRGKHVHHPAVDLYQARSVVLEATDAGGPPPPAFADGERISRLPVRVTVVPGALLVLDPRDHTITPG